MNRNRPNCRGFTLVEVMIVGMMMGVVAIALSSAWSGLAQPSIDSMVRCCVEKEAQIAAMYLANDFGGCPPVVRSAIQGKLDDSPSFSSAGCSDDALLITFSDGSTIAYSLDDTQHALVRTRTMADASASSVVVASNIYDVEGEEEEGRIKLTLTLQFSDTLSSKYRQQYKYVFSLPMAL